MRLRFIAIVTLENPPRIPEQMLACRLNSQSKCCASKPPRSNKVVLAAKQHQNYKQKKTNRQTWITSATVATSCIRSAKRKGVAPTRGFRPGARTENSTHIHTCKPCKCKCKHVGIENGVRAISSVYCVYWHQKLSHNQLQNLGGSCGGGQSALLQQ